ncbi:MAG TPA: GTPase Era [Candidatus Coprovivens excrementavium]|nr:GTPase Era [Candidatus Coprovivens excrementavium]
MRSGFVSLIGRPNVGKSTLLNSLINQKIAITSNKPQTTRNIIQGIYNEDGYQIVFVDTPGIHKPLNKLGRVLNKEAQSLTKDVDVILLLVDAKDGLGIGDKKIIASLTETDSKVILVLNKIDKMNETEILKAINDYKDLYPFAEIVPISAITKENVDTLLNVIKKYLTDNMRYFDDDTITTSTLNFLVSEFVREKIFRMTEEEIPHSVTCITSKFEETSKIINITVDIIVDRDSIKKIIIGKQGSLLKTVGIEARKDIENLVGKKVYLELYVKTIKNWRDRDRYLAELGFDEKEYIN